MTDADFLHQILSDGRWHGWHEIMQASIRERGHGLTIHSRAAQLRKRGLHIDCKTDRISGRSVSFYRLRPLDATNDEPLIDPPVSMGLPSQSFVASSGPAPNPDASSLPGTTDAQITTTAAIGDEAGPPVIDGQLCLEVAA